MKSQLLPKLRRRLRCIVSARFQFREDIWVDLLGIYASLLDALLRRRPPGGLVELVLVVLVVPPFRRVVDVLGYGVQVALEPYRNTLAKQGGDMGKSSRVVETIIVSTRN